MHYLLPILVSIVNSVVVDSVLVTPSHVLSVVKEEVLDDIAIHTDIVQ